MGRADAATMRHGVHLAATSSGVVQQLQRRLGKLRHAEHAEDDGRAARQGEFAQSPFEVMVGVAIEMALGRQLEDPAALVPHDSTKATTSSQEACRDATGRLSEV